PGAGEVRGRVDDHAAVAKVGQGVDFVDRLSRPGLVEMKLRGQEDDVAPLLFAAFEETIALVGAAHAQEGRAGAGAHERVSAATGERLRRVYQKKSRLRLRGRFRRNRPRSRKRLDPAPS